MIVAVWHEKGQFNFFLYIHVYSSYISDKHTEYLLCLDILTVLIYRKKVLEELFWFCCIFSDLALYGVKALPEVKSSVNDGLNNTVAKCQEKRKFYYIYIYILISVCWSGYNISVR